MHDDFFKELKKDHEEVRSILEQLKATGNKAEKKREELFLKLKQEIKPHMEAEEKVFYPALQKKAHEKILESIEEHHAADVFLIELEKMGKTEDRWAAKLSVFKEIVEHHLEEEEGDIFKLADEAMDHDQMPAILKQFQEQKQKVKKAMA
jgi:hemerythrin-like domain-containing protein